MKLSNEINILIQNFEYQSFKEIKFGEVLNDLSQNMERTLSITVDDISTMENWEKEALFKTLINEATSDYKADEFDRFEIIG